MTKPTERKQGWRAEKGVHQANTSGFHAQGHMLLLLERPVETVTSSGIVIPEAVADKERTRATVARVVEIGHDCWTDKTTDYCEVGDDVLIGMYVGKLQRSDVDGQMYRFVKDLDIIATVHKGDEQ
jgi:co-chaperonin GroES (HSP10)